jgi:pyruvate dehydrogenase E2 component (dihydrolipoamide acetyltransferase)
VAAKGSLLSRTERDVEIEVDDGGNGRVIASPYVRKVARERGIDLASAHGSGQHGRIVPADLDAMPKGGAPAATKQAAKESGAKDGSSALARAPQGGLATPGALALAPPEVRPLSPMRKTIARRLTQSKQTVPHFYLTIDVDAEPLVQARKLINLDLEQQKGKDGAVEKISVNDLLIKACAVALRRVPGVNASFTPEALVLHQVVDISVAVAVPDGLLTPVVRDADTLGVLSIARAVRDLAGRAKDKKLKPEEMTGGTFSISNLGMFGVEQFAAVINPPEGAILAVGAVRDEPVVKDGAVVPGQRLRMTLSCDHRVVDGALGAQFLAVLKRLVESPVTLLV